MCVYCAFIYVSIKTYVLCLCHFHPPRISHCFPEEIMQEISLQKDLGPHAGCMPKFRLQTKVSDSLNFSWNSSFQIPFYCFLSWGCAVDL